MPRGPLSDLNSFSQQAAVAFDKVDANHDRKLSYDEFARMHSDSLDASELQACFDEIDADKSGTSARTASRTLDPGLALPTLLTVPAFEPLCGYS